MADSLADPFRFEYDPATVRYGPNCVSQLASEVTTLGCERTLVVTGATVGETAAVMDPVRAGLDDRLAGVVAETTPAKRLGTAYEALSRYLEADADSIVAVGGGSSLDVATVLSVLVATDREPEAVGAELRERGTISVPGSGLPPVITVPTTLAGADLSQVAGVTADPATCPVDEPASGAVDDPRLMPAAACYDPELVATTPETVLAGSAMNGFDKGVETLYARSRTPITDATATRGLGLLADGLAAFGDGDRSESTFQRLTQGILLVQYGISRPDGTTLSLIHALGHGLARTSDLQQGTAHAVVAPHALASLFDAVDGRRELLAAALGVEDAADPAAAVVDRVGAIAAGLGLPARLRDVDGPDREALPAVADAVLADPFMRNGPAELDLSREDILGVLEAAW